MQGKVSERKSVWWLLCSGKVRALVFRVQGLWFRILDVGSKI